MRTLLLFCLFIGAKVSAQHSIDSIIAFSELENIILDQGRLLKVEGKHVGTAGNIQVGSIEAVDLSTGEKKKGFGFVHSAAFNVSFDAADLHVDAAEVKQLIVVLKKFSEIIKDKNVKGDLAYQYVFPSYFVASIQNRIVRQNKWDIIFYKRYRNFNVAVPGNVISVRDSDLDSLITLLEHQSLD